MIALSMFLTAPAYAMKHNRNKCDRGNFICKGVKFGNRVTRRIARDIGKPIDDANAERRRRDRKRKSKRRDGSIYDRDWAPKW